MPDRIPFELVNAPADSPSRVEEIDTCRYADESVPRGYARVASVEENKSPESCEGGKVPATRPATSDTVSWDQRFENEKL